MSTTPLPPYPPQAHYYPPVNPIAGPVKVFGIIYAVLAALSLMGAIALLCIGAISGKVVTDNAESMNGVTPHVGILFIVLAVIALAFTALHAFTAYGLLAKKTWGRTLTIVSSIILLLSIPVGTICGGIALYFFLRTGADQDYAQLTLNSSL